MLRTYNVGKYGDVLGLPATGPCIEVECEIERGKTLRILLRLCFRKRPKRAVLCHRCDNRKCVSIQHLFWSTQSDNMRDCLLKGRMPGKTVGDIAERIRKLELRLGILYLRLISRDK